MHVVREVVTNHYYSNRKGKKKDVLSQTVSRIKLTLHLFVVTGRCNDGSVPTFYPSSKNRGRREEHSRPF